MQSTHHMPWGTEASKLASYQVFLLRTYLRAGESDASWLHSEVFVSGIERRELGGDFLLHSHWVSIEGVGEGLVVEYIISLDSLCVVQQRYQILDVSAGQTKRIYLGELSVGGVGWNEFPQLVECRVDCVHPLSLSAIGCNSLHFAWARLRCFLVCVTVGLYAVPSVRATASRTPS